MIRRSLFLVALFWHPAFAQTNGAGSQPSTPPTSQQRASAAEGYPSLWTVDTLHALINTRLNEIILSIEARFVALEKTLEAAQTTQDTRVRDALAAADKAAISADNSVQKQISSSADDRKELQARIKALEAQILMLMPRADAERRVEQAERKLSELSTRIDIREGQSGGQNQLWTLIGGGIILIIAIVGFFFMLAGRMQSMQAASRAIETPRNSFRSGDGKS